MISPDELAFLRRQTRRSDDELAAMLGRSRRTWRRWRSEGAPAWVGGFLEVIGGRLELLGGPEWRGWWFRDGVIYPAGLATRYYVGPADIYRIWWDRQRIRLLERTTDQQEPHQQQRHDHQRRA